MAQTVTDLVRVAWHLQTRSCSDVRSFWCGKVGVAVLLTLVVLVLLLLAKLFSVGGTENRF